MTQVLAIAALILSVFALLCVFGVLAHTHALTFAVFAVVLVAAALLSGK
jgi:hypothetical protein